MKSIWNILLFRESAPLNNIVLVMFRSFFFVVGGGRAGN